MEPCPAFVRVTGRWRMDLCCEGFCGWGRPSGGEGGSWG